MRVIRDCVRACVFALAILPGLSPAASPRAELCLQSPDDAPVTEGQSRLSAMVKRLQQTGLAADAFLDLATEHRTQICLEPQATEARGYFDFEANHILLKASLDDDALLAILVHELRHLDQYFRGFCPSTDFDIREEVRFTFAVEADAAAYATHISWRMKEAGDPGPWNALLDFRHYRDIAVAYELALAEGGTSGMALGSAYDQWFRSDWRRENYSLSTCSQYYDELDRTKRLQSYDPRVDGSLRDICRLPDGSVYECGAVP